MSSRMAPRCLLACAFAGVAAAAVCSTVNVSNVDPRFTASGDQVRAQDGNILNVKINGSFAMVGMLYGLCQYQGCTNESFGACGFGPGEIAVCEAVLLAARGGIKAVFKTVAPPPPHPDLSADLGNTGWSDPIEILPASMRPTGIYFRPHLLFNPATRLFVLWVRWLPVDGPSLSDDPDLYLVATSPSITAPFTVVTVNATMYYNNSADDNLFADEDGSAYSE